MRHVRADQLKFFNSKACINRADGARLEIIGVVPTGDGPGYRIYYHTPSSNAPTTHVWEVQDLLVVQAVINEFRKGSDFKGEDYGQ